ncbi:MAG: hypothetical protein EOM20_09760 [Spartobacteria bacterium]|nr:hypothetical protein [Spartobacteria bacterium]
MFNTLILSLATDEELLEHYFDVNSSVRERIITHLQKSCRAKIEDIILKPCAFKMSQIRRIFAALDGGPDSFNDWITTKRSIAYSHERYARKLVKEGGPDYTAFMDWVRELNTYRARALLDMLEPSTTSVRQLMPPEAEVGERETVINQLKQHDWITPEPPYHYMREYEDIDKARPFEVNFPLKVEPDPEDDKKKLLHYVGVYLLSPGEFGVWKDCIQQ